LHPYLGRGRQQCNHSRGDQENFYLSIGFASPVTRHEFCSMSDMGRVLVVIGVITVIAGLLLWTGLAPRWLGRLPGDIRIERGNSAFYFPIVTCIIISVVLSLIFSLFRR
jgi:hypothetical protein